jgi:hypothetical protein
MLSKTMYEDLMVCYKTGQMSERQFQEHLKDKDFAFYVEKMHHKNSYAQLSIFDMNNDMDI